jgi:hypothetical protein
VRAGDYHASTRSCSVLQASFWRCPRLRGEPFRVSKVIRVIRVTIRVIRVIRIIKVIRVIRVIDRNRVGCKMAVQGRQLRVVVHVVHVCGQW